MCVYQHTLTARLGKSVSTHLVDAADYGRTAAQALCARRHARAP